MRAPPHSPSTSPTNRGGPASSPASKRPQPPPEAIGLGRPVQWTNAENLKIVGRLVEGSSTKNLVILCHGYASSKDSPLNCRLARELSSKGFSSLRFDFSGNGESDGVFSFSSYYKEVRDLQSAVAYARGTLGRMVVAIVGHSKGGDVVLMYGSAFDDVPLVVNIAGRFNMTRGFRERFGEATIAKVEHLGQVKQKVMSDLGQPIEFMLTKHDLAERAGIDMVAVCSKITLAEVLTVHGSGDTVIPIEDAQAFASAIRQHQLLVVEGADHNFRTPAHAEEAVRKIVAFIEGGV